MRGAGLTWGPLRHSPVTARDDGNRRTLMWRMWLAALFWGLNWAAVKIMLAAISPWTLRAAGLACGGSILAGFAIASRQSLAIPRSQWRQLVIAALLNVAGFNLCAVFAQLTMPASRAAIVTFTMPLWATLFAWIFLKEPIDRLRALSLAVGATGLVILSSSFWPQMRSGELPLGLVFVLGAAVSWAAGTVYLKQARIAATPIAITTWQVIVAAVVCTVGMVLFETPRFDLSSPRVAAAFAYHIALPQAASYVLWFSLMTRVSSSTASLGTLLIPVFGVIGAVVILGDQPTVVDLAGFALLFLAVVVDQGLRQQSSPERQKC